VSVIKPPEDIIKEPNLACPERTLKNFVANGSVSVIVILALQKTDTSTVCTSSVGSNPKSKSAKSVAPTALGTEKKMSALNISRLVSKVPQPELVDSMYELMVMIKLSQKIIVFVRLTRLYLQGSM
jgi:hypothetical protein